MIRLCLKQFGNESKLAVLALTDPSKSLKCTSTFNSITRKYAIKLKEETPIGTEKIYYGTLTPQIKAIKIFSLCTSIAGIAIQPMLIREASSIGSTSLLVAICSVVGFFTFVTPILLHFITKKYVTEIYYNAETSTYKAITINFFATKRIHEFKVEDVFVPDVPGMFTTMHANGKPLFIEARFFNNPLHYAKIMGYDKPMDFKLGETQESKNQK
ncbi:transmembrane protein 70 homolog, mitochondrial [Bombyx mandarina]|uniref:Transmembrane protein 70 homolog, mitochondrial n=2 Tax=Bombyx TaxID=7090 RepID=A0A8R2M229_BOMMO|nr:transmembrane protein 70 homolog, mitochondrial [Bombyx mandarina]XP_037872715.1 transmembrane protein 70 homolog, mitochondrial [Bombyx mori]